MRTTTWLCALTLAGAMGCQSDERIVFSSQRLALVAPEALVVGSDGLELRHLASVAPPSTAGGQRVQATGFDSDGQGHYYVSYNSMGEASYGALEVLAGECRHDGDLRVVASRVFEDYEFAAVRRHRGAIVAVGAKRGAGAVLVVAELRGQALHVRSELTLEPAFYATSISIERDVAFVSTGDNDGVRRVDLGDLDAPRVVGFTALPNATYVERAFDTTLVLGGSGDTGLYREVQGAFTLSMPIATGVLAAPNRMARVDDLAVFNGGGLSVVRFGSNFATSGAAEVLSRRPLDGTSNGISIDGARRVYAAQGDAGLQLFDVCDPTDPLLLGTVDFPSDWGSANDVHYAEINSSGRGNNVQRVLFLADGLGGFKVITLRIDPKASVAMEARKLYNPSRWENGRFAVAAPASYRVPETIEVTSGNAGNHTATLSFDAVTCTYKGGSSQAHPAGTTQVGLGQRYVFQSCSNGARAGRSVRASCRVALRIDNGDSNLADTRVRATLTRDTSDNAED